MEDEQVKPADEGRRSSDQLGLAPKRAEVAYLDDGEAWSFCRTVMSDGRDILQWHPDEGYERHSARMDAQASKRGDELMAMVRRLISEERNRAAQVCEDEARIRREAGDTHPEESPERGRCYAGARAAINCAKGVRSGEVVRPNVRAETPTPAQKE